MPPVRGRVWSHPSLGRLCRHDATRIERIDRAERAVEFGPILSFKSLADLFHQLGRLHRADVRVDRFLVHARRDEVGAGLSCGRRRCRPRPAPRSQVPPRFDTAEPPSRARHRSGRRAPHWPGSAIARFVSKHRTPKTFQCRQARHGIATAFAMLDQKVPILAIIGMLG